MQKMRQRWLQDKGMLRPNHSGRNQAASPSEDAFSESNSGRNKKDPAGRAWESGRQHCGNPGPTKKGPKNRSHPEEGLGGRVQLRRKSGHRNAGFSLRSPQPVGSDQYTTTGLQTMAITRKRKEPSAGTDESEDSQGEDGGPSKKTATHHLNVMSPEHIPIPRSGTVPVVTMIIRRGESEEIARILLDTGSTVPLLSQSFTKNKRIATAERPKERPIQV